MSGLVFFKNINNNNNTLRATTTTTTKKGVFVESDDSVLFDSSHPIVRVRCCACSTAAIRSVRDRHGGEMTLVRFSSIFCDNVKQSCQWNRRASRSDRGVIYHSWEEEEKKTFRNSVPPAACAPTIAWHAPCTIGPI